MTKFLASKLSTKKMFEGSQRNAHFKINFYSYKILKNSYKRALTIEIFILMLQGILV